MMNRIRKGITIMAIAGTVLVTGVFCYMPFRELLKEKNKKTVSLQEETGIGTAENTAEELYKNMTNMSETSSANADEDGINQDKEAKKAQKIVEVKEIKLSQTIDIGDINVRAKQTREFIAAGNKVKVSLRMKGRQQEHPEISVEVLENFYEKVKDVAVMEKKPTSENRSVFMMLVPIKNK